MGELSGFPGFLQLFSITALDPRPRAGSADRSDVAVTPIAPATTGLCDPAVLPWSRCLLGLGWLGRYNFIANWDSGAVLLTLTEPPKRSISGGSVQGAAAEIDDGLSPSARPDGKKIIAIKIPSLGTFLLPGAPSALSP